MNLLSRIVAILLLALTVFMLGANQHRTGSWPFGQSAFTGVTRFVDEDKNQDIQKELKIAGWIDKLKKGGYLIYLRHANREKWPEHKSFDIHEFASKIQDASQTPFKRAVCLSDQGIEEAKLIGETFKRETIPVGRVVSSPSCRAKQTATYAFGKFDAIENSLLLPDIQSDAYSHETVNQLIAFLKAVEIKPGTNTVISAHGGTLERFRGEAIKGDMPMVLETGFHIIERGSDNKLAIVFSIMSLNELAINGVDLSKNP